MSTTKINQAAAESYAKDAQHQVTVAARELKELADYLLLLAQEFTNERIMAAERAAEIVSNYIQGTGSIGCRVGELVSYAAKADQCRRSDPGRKPPTPS